MDHIFITSHTKEPLIEFFELNNFFVEKIDRSVLKVEREDELPVFINMDGNNMYFEVDLGNINSIASQELYFKLLDMNTEILPVSFGINNTNPEDPRLVLVESRITDDLNHNEILSVFDALELAVDKAETILSAYLK